MINHQTKEIRCQLDKAIEKLVSYIFTKEKITRKVFAQRTALLRGEGIIGSEIFKGPLDSCLERYIGLGVGSGFVGQRGGELG